MKYYITLSKVLSILALVVFSGCASLQNNASGLALEGDKNTNVQGEYVPVQSTMFKEARYSEDKTLSIKFIRGQVIHYRNVPENVAERFINVAGRRGYYKTHIRDDYTSERVEAAREPKKLVAVKMSYWDKPKVIYETEPY